MAMMAITAGSRAGRIRSLFITALTVVKDRSVEFNEREVLDREIRSATVALKVRFQVIVILGINVGSVALATDAVDGFHCFAFLAGVLPLQVINARSSAKCAVGTFTPTAPNQSIQVTCGC